MSDRRSVALFALVITVCLAAVGGVWWIRHGGSGSDGTALEADAGSAVVVVDGWSRAVLGTDPTWGQDGTASGTAVWRDMSEGDARDLLATDPATVANLMARMVVAVPRPQCDTKGCRSGDTDLPLRYLSDPGSIPGYGPMYEAWGIGPVRVAQLSLFPETQALTFAVGASTSGPYQVSGGGGSSPQVADGAQSEAETEAGLDTTSASTANVIALGGGFGSLFPLRPAWTVGTEGQPARAYDTSGVLLGLDPAIDAQLDKTSATGSAGLAVEARDLWGLDPSALTALSSPTTGCLGMVLCAPGEVEVSVEGGVLGVDSACDTSTAAGSFAGGNARVAVVARDETWTPALPHPIAQSGAWAGQEPPAPVAGIWGPGPMPLYDGSSPLRLQTATIYAGQGSVWAFAGRFTEVGIDPDPAPWGTEAALAAVGSERYTPCERPTAEDGPGSSGPGAAPGELGSGNPFEPPGSGSGSGAPDTGRPPDAVGDGTAPESMVPGSAPIDTTPLPGPIPDRAP
jgi:hypothetical protein